LGYVETGKPNRKKAVMPCDDPNCGRTEPHWHTDYPGDSTLILADSITIEDLHQAGEQQAAEEHAKRLEIIAARARRQ
jgi:hypothetical protein